MDDKNTIQNLDSRILLIQKKSPQEIIPWALFGKLGELSADFGSGFSIFPTNLEGISLYLIDQSFF